MLQEAARRRDFLNADGAREEEYWLARAKLTHNRAANAKDPKLQQRLQKVAFEYERLAACAAQTITVAS